MNPFDRLMKAAQHTQLSPEFGNSVEAMRRKVYAGQDPQYGSSMPEVVKKVLSPFAKDMDTFASGQPSMSSPMGPGESFSPPVGIGMEKAKVSPLPGGGMRMERKGQMMMGMSMPMEGGMEDMGEGPETPQEDRLHDTDKGPPPLPGPGGPQGMMLGKGSPLDIPEELKSAFGLNMNNTPEPQGQSLFSDNANSQGMMGGAPESLQNASATGTEIPQINGMSPVQDIAQMKGKFLQAAKSILGSSEMVPNSDQALTKYLMPFYSQGNLPDPNSPEFRKWVWQNLYNASGTTGGNFSGSPGVRLNPISTESY